MHFTTSTVWGFFKNEIIVHWDPSVNSYAENKLIIKKNVLSYICVVSEVVQTLQLRDQTDAVGDLSVCLDGMTVDPEMFATAEADQHCK